MEEEIKLGFHKSPTVVFLYATEDGKHHVMHAMRAFKADVINGSKVIARVRVAYTEGHYDESRG